MRVWTESDIARLRALKASGASNREIARALGYTLNAVEKAVQRHCLKSFDVEQPPRVARPIEQLIAALTGEFKRKREHHEAKREIRVTIAAEPFALAIFGDCHIDDPGCDVETLRDAIEWCKDTPGVLAVNIGDLANNWIGRLERLYQFQQVTSDEGRDLTRWLLQALPWLLVILGNHDKWTPVAEMLCREAGVVYASHGCRVALCAPDCDPFVCDFAHDMPGRSQFTPAFAAIKRVYRGTPAELIACGHIHSGASAVGANGIAGTRSNAIRVGAFKIYDEYADARGFSRDDAGPLAIAVIDPRLPAHHPGRCVVHWDMERAARELKGLQT